MRDEPTKAQNVQQCIQDCLTCYGICLQMSMNVCLEQGGTHVESEHFRLMSTCSDICRTAANFMLSSSPHCERVCAACAEVCEACADSCEQRVGLEECARACRRCARSCREIAGANSEIVQAPVRPPRRQRPRLWAVPGGRL